MFDGFVKEFDFFISIVSSRLIDIFCRSQLPRSYPNVYGGAQGKEKCFS